MTREVRRLRGLTIMNYDNDVIIKSKDIRIDGKKWIHLIIERRKKTGAKRRLVFDGV